MGIYRQGTLVAKTAKDIIAGIEDPGIRTLLVPGGTYDIGSISDYFDLPSDKTVIFQGDVIFQDAQIRTVTAADSDYFDHDNTSTVTWDSGNTQWDRSGGSSWAATTEWQIFVRDRWYTASAVTANDFTVNETPVGYGLTSAQQYVLCKPTERLRVEGSLTLDYQASATTEWVVLAGLKNCDLSRWSLSVFAPKNLSTSPQSVFIRDCAQTSLPQIRLAHQISTASDNNNGIACKHLHQCVASNWTIENLGATSYGWSGLYLEFCQYSRFVDVVVSGVNETSGSNGVVNFALVACRYCYVSGVSCGPHSSAGSETHVSDSGGTANDTSDILQRAS